MLAPDWRISARNVQTSAPDWWIRSRGVQTAAPDWWIRSRGVHTSAPDWRIKEQREREKDTRDNRLVLVTTGQECTTTLEREGAARRHNAERSHIALLRREVALFHLFTTLVIAAAQ
eukprot:1190483-Prorocentrum_minimum.AAC.6